MMSDAERKAKASERNRAWRLANPERCRENRNKWRAANPEKRAAAARRYAQAHPDKVLEKSRRHQQRHPERILASAAKYREANREKVNAVGRAYFQTPEGKAARVNGERRRRARKMGALTVASASDINAMLLAATCCHYCRIAFDEQTRPTVDHVIPLARGGAHDMDNLVAACSLCNSQKGTKLPSEFIPRANVSVVAVGSFT